MDSEVPHIINDLQTPCFLVDYDRLKRNCQKMLQKCQDMSIELRPHMKTHKTIEAGDLMTGGTRKKIVVSTIVEAKFYGDAGFDDILYGVVLEPSKLLRCKTLAGTIPEFHVMIDTLEGLKMLENEPLNGKKWSVFLKIDTGYHRAGVRYDNDEAVSLARSIVSSRAVHFMGLYTHDGLTYDAKGAEVAKENDVANERMLQLWHRLKSLGIEVPHCTTGSTPGVSLHGRLLGQMTEIHPGNYVFYDWEHCLIGACSFEDVACRVACRVVGHYGDMLLVDCGFTAISHDKSRDHASYSYFCDHPNLELYSLSQELGRVRDKEGTLDVSKYPVGSILYMYPFHSCATAAMHPQYFVHSGEKILNVWKPCRGW